jgi:hypothetical protein
MSAYEYDYEPIRGLPGHLPEGEEILWQGGPDWAAFAVHALHVRVVTLYFSAIVLAQPIFAALRAPADREGIARAIGEALWTAGVGALAIGLLCLFALLVARTTVYTITNRRVVLRIGVAIAKAVNVPFNLIDSAALRIHAGGSGDVPLIMVEGAKPSYILLWPHVRPFHLNKPQPMLRAVPNAKAAADILAAALIAAAAQRQAAASPSQQKAWQTGIVPDADETSPRPQSQRPAAASALHQPNAPSPAPA